MAQRPATQQRTAPAKTAARRPAADERWEGAAPVDAEDTGFGGGIVPEGGYAVVVEKAYFRQSQSSGKEYVNLELQIIKGDFEGRYLFCPLYVQSDSDNFRKGQKGFLAKWFEVCTGEVPVFPEVDDDLVPLIGCEAWVKAIVEPNQDAKGNTIEQNRIVRVRDLAEARAEARASKPGSKAAPAQRTRAAPVEDEAEDDAEAEDEAPPPQRATRAPAKTAAPARTAAPVRGKKGAAAFEDMDDDIPF